MISPYSGPTEYAVVEVVSPQDLSQLGIVPPKMSDPEWSAPFKAS